MKRMFALLMSVWLGAQIGFGYVVVPILFGRLNNLVAGELAGQLFHVVNYLGLLVWVVGCFVVSRTSAWQSVATNQRIRYWMMLLLLLIAVSEFLVTPAIAALKAGETFWLLNWTGGTFKTWHGFSSILYLMQTILGLVMTIKLLRLAD